MIKKMIYYFILFYLSSKNEINEKNETKKVHGPKLKLEQPCFQGEVL